MKVFRGNTRVEELEERSDFRMMREFRELRGHRGHGGPGRHVPPHERRAMMHIEFDEGDWGLLQEIFGDEDTAAAAAEIIQDAPPEIKVLAVQLINLIEEVA